MFVTIESYKTGWYEISIGIGPNEIDLLIKQLTQLKKDPDQHFHITSDYEGESGIGDIEFYIQDDRKSNMAITGAAISPNR
jgi:hypothetical protein